MILNINFVIFIISNFLLSQIIVGIFCSFLSLKVFLLDENVDTLLDDGNLWLEPKQKSRC